jgi:guanylate kinase
VGQAGVLLVITGPSAVGKSAIVGELVRNRPHIRYSISCTTRSPRLGETDGVEYFFVTREEFERKAQTGQLLEWAEVYGNYYGTPRDYVEAMLANGQNVILDIDINGAVQVREKYPEAVSIFVIPPTVSELRNRIMRRAADSAESVERRLAQVPRWLEQGLTYDYVLVNDDLARAVEQLGAIVIAERCRTASYGKALISALLEKGEL